MLTIPPTGATDREVHQRIRELIEGRSNAVDRVTLEANATQTIFAKETINANAIALLSPTTASAAQGSASGAVYVSTIAAGSVTITHDSSAATDRTYGVLIIGG